MMESDGGTSGACDHFLYDRQIISEWRDSAVIADRDGVNDRTDDTLCSIKMSPCKRRVAVFSSGSVEIRSDHDDFKTPVGVCHLTATAVNTSCVSAQQMAWSDSGRLLAVFVDQCVHILDQHAIPLSSTHLSADTSVVQLLFDSHRCTFQLPSAAPSSSASSAKTGSPPESVCVDSAERVLLISGDGCLTAFDVSSDGSLSRLFSRQLFFDARCSLPLSGVSSAVLLAPGDLLVVAANGGGFVGDVRLQGMASYDGLTAWRLVSETPFALPCLSETERRVISHGHNWLSAARRWLVSQVIISRGAAAVVDSISTLRVSPDGRKLAAVHSSGALSLWKLPVLRKISYWPTASQPYHDVVGPHLLQLPTEQRQELLDSWCCYGLLMDVSWWSSTALVLARYGGSVSICTLQEHELCSLFGDDSEFFGSHPSVAVAHLTERDGLVLVVEQTRLPTVKRNDSTTEHNSSLIGQWLRPVLSVKQWLTDSDRLEPPQRRPSRSPDWRSCGVEENEARGWRICCLRRCTPQQLLACRLQQGEFAEALSLAQKFALDTDSVYLRQWHASEPNEDAIEQYLCRVESPLRAVSECCTRLPATAAAASLLIEHGLRLTDKSLSSRDLPLSDESLQLLSARRRLLKHAESLRVFLQLVSTESEVEGEAPFVPAQYGRFRDTPLLQSALEMARRGNWRVLSQLLSARAVSLRPWRLPLLANLPSSLSPFEYAPVLSHIDNAFPSQPAQSTDWSSKWVHLLPVGDTDDDGTLECPSYAPYLANGCSPPKRVISDWFCGRALHIVTATNLPEFGVQLLELGVSNGVEGLDQLLRQLRAMCSLVHTGAGFVNITWSQFSSLSEDKVVEMLMVDGHASNVQSLMRDRLIPYLSQISSGQRMHLMSSWLSAQAAKTQDAGGLQLVARVVELLTDQYSGMSDLLSRGQMIESVLACASACDSGADVKLLRRILLNVVEWSGEESNAMIFIGPTLDLITAVELLVDKFDRQTSISHLASLSSDHSGSVALLESVCRRFMMTGGCEAARWSKLITDVIQLRRLAVPSVSPPECVEICVAALLAAASSPQEIQSVGAILFSCDRQKQLLPASIVHCCPCLERACQLVVTAAREHFDSASSLYDNSLNTARQLLMLIPRSAADSCDVQHELALLDSCTCLRELGAELLPLRLRSATASKWLLHVCVDSLPSPDKMHCHYEQLKRLVRLLRLPDSWQLHQLVVRRALAAGESAVAMSACRALADECGAESWPAFALLASSASVGLPERLEAVSFAITHSPARRLSQLLQLQRRLQSLQRSSREEASGRHIQSPVGVIRGTRHLVKSTASSVLEVTSKSAVSLITLASAGDINQPVLHSEQKENNKNAGRKQSVSCKLHHSYVLPVFYEGLYGDDGEIINSFVYNPVLDGDNCRIYSDTSICLLKDFMNSSFVDNSNQLTNLWTEFASADWHVLMIIAGCLQGSSTAILSVVSQDSHILLCIYCRALNALFCRRDLSDEIFCWSVDRVIAEARASEGAANLNLDELMVLADQKALCRQLNFVSDGRESPDVARFIADHQYQKLLLSPLVATSDEHSAEVLWQLATRCQPELLEFLAVGHVVYLFSGGRNGELLSVAELRSCLSRHSLAKYARKCRTLSTALEARAEETIDGIDLERLAVLYDLLVDHADHTDAGESDGVSRKYSSRRQLLLIMREHVSALNFWRILASADGTSCVDLSDLLCLKNVDMIVDISDDLCGEINASLVHSCWLQKCIFQVLKSGRGSEASESREIPANVLQDLTHHLKLVSASDFITCASNLLFSDAAINSGMCIRRQLLSWLDKSINGRQNESLWRPVFESFTAWSEHFDYLEWDSFQELLSSEDGCVRRFLLSFDRSRGESSGILQARDGLVTDGCSAQVLSHLLGVLPMQFVVEPLEAIIHAVDSYLTRMLNRRSVKTDPGASFDHDEDNLHIRTIDLDSRTDPPDVISDSDDDSGREEENRQNPCGIGECIKSCLESAYFQPITLASSLKESCENCQLSPAEKSRFLNRITRASPSLRLCFPEFVFADTQRALVAVCHISPEDVTGESNRLALFERAIASPGASTRRGIESVHKVCLSWPLFSAEVYSDTNRNPVLRLCEQAVSLDLSVPLQRFVSAHINTGRLPSDQLWSLIEKLRLSGRREVSARLASMSEDAGIRSAAVDDSCCSLESGESWPLQTAWLRTLIECNLMPLLVSGPLYEAAVECLSEDQVPRVIQQLRNAGMGLEAARLLMDVRSSKHSRHQQQPTISAVKNAASTIFSRLMPQ